MKTFTDQRGSLIIEVMLSITVMVVFSLALVSMVRTNSHAIEGSRSKTQALGLARESLEQVVAIKSDHWADVQKEGYFKISTVVSGTGEMYRLDNSSPAGEPVAGTNFTRTIRLDKGKRTSATGPLDQSGPFIDDHVRLATVTVQWNDGTIDRNVEISTYITNWKEAT